MNTTSMRGITRLLIAIAGLWMSTLSVATPEGETLVRQADEARGGGIPGLIWDVRAVTSGTDSDSLPEHRLRVKAAESASLAEVLEPANSRGSKMLQVERNWRTPTPGLPKPVAISPRLRLTGQAAVGDIAATNYAKDYEATYVREERCGERACHVLDLVARTKRTTYDRITYWIDVERGTAIKAEFLSPSGKLLKSARFEYDNVVDVGGRSIPFISRMLISDALSDSRTELEYSRIQIEPVAASEFDVANLQ
jgi:hypothetical protein